MVTNQGNRTKFIALAIVMVAFFIVPVFIRNPYILHIFIWIGIIIIFTISYRCILTTGQFSFGHQGFIGIGAYTSALLVMRLGVSFWLALPLAGIVAGLIALLTGFPFLKVRGLYFAILTWGFAEVMRAVYMRMRVPFGGPGGIAGIPRPDPIPVPFFSPIEFTSLIPYYYLALVLLLLTLVVLYQLERSRFGLIFRAINESDLLTKSAGINIMRYKLLAFVIGSFFAGIGGAFLAHYRTFISPADFGVMLGIFIIIYVQVGGAATFAGPIVGAAILGVVDEVFSGYGVYRTTFYALLLIVVTLFFPGGIVGLFRSASSTVRTLWKKEETGAPT